MRARRSAKVERERGAQVGLGGREPAKAWEGKSEEGAAKDAEQAKRTALLPELKW